MKISEIDKSKLIGFEQARALMYKLLQEALRKPTLHEVIGRDLQQQVFNLPWERLRDKDKAQFDDMMLRLAADESTLLVISGGKWDITKEELTELQVQSTLLRKSVKEQMEGGADERQQ